MNAQQKNLIGPVAANHRVGGLSPSRGVNIHAPFRSIVRRRISPLFRGFPHWQVVIPRGCHPLPLKCLIFLQSGVQSMSEDASQISESETRCSCVLCPECKGAGIVWFSFTGRYLGSSRCDDLDDMETCEECRGEGLHPDHICDYCIDQYEHDHD